MTSYLGHSSNQSDGQHTSAAAATTQGFFLVPPPPPRSKDARSMSTSSAMSGMPGSFNSQLTITRSETPKPKLFPRQSYEDDDSLISSQQKQADLREKIDKETKIKIGSENLLEALNAKNPKQAKVQKLRVEAELNSSNRKLAELKLGLEAEIQRVRRPVEESPPRLSNLFRSALPRSPSKNFLPYNDGDGDDEEDDDPETESPTFVLSELLQALEAEGRQPDYYVERANALVDLFKRHPTLKYDLVWSIFSLRVQVMLLSNSREVVAAGYRVMRYAITDRKSLQTIRSLHTDNLVIVSLVKESKASVEREQALKFIRAFLDVKDGIKEISKAVIRIIVAVAEHHDDRLRQICLLTLCEILIRDPPLLVSAGGMGVLTDALGDGNFHATGSLAAAFIYLLDFPHRRVFLRSGYELGTAFATFTEAPSLASSHEEQLKSNARVIAVFFKSWPGMVAMCANDMLSIRSLVLSLYTSSILVRDVLLELFFDILKIKSPSWSSSFLAGRRLTTYGRVTNLNNEPTFAAAGTADPEDELDERSLVEHFTALSLAILLHAGLLNALLYIERDVLDAAQKRKTTLLLGQILRMSSQLLPDEWSSKLQILPDLFTSATLFGSEGRYAAVSTAYQVDSVNRTLYRSGVANVQRAHWQQITGKDEFSAAASQAEQAKASQGGAAATDEGQFRLMIVESQVLNTLNYTKWRWDVIQNIVEGPLLNPKRLDEALRASKFVHRVIGFYRPFKYWYSEIRNTRPNQRYTRAGCALIRTLLQNPDGVKYLAESKLIRQLAECLSHFDRMSGLTSTSPLFSAERMSETLTGGYFALLGALSADARGVQILERWKVFNMFYHIVELRGRDDLIKMLLQGMDYTIDGHLRIILSKAMIACSKHIRIFATRLLRKYATRPLHGRETVIPHTGVAEWAIKLLINQLYDPDVEVCEVAVKILEEACNRKQSLEYVVKCRPTLDHLGEIGAPLLLRFLSTSVGYHYLDGLDYISREMDDWFLGRNDSYVLLVEASLARALADVPMERTQQHPSAADEPPERQELGLVPPHFYRELTRTNEGCRLLEQKGHFDEFAAVIQESAMEDADAETVLKVKGCLWAVGNVGSMELGAPFLERSDVVRWIVRIAEESEVLTLRGTAFFVLGLISRTIHGQEILAEHGWDGAMNESGLSVGYCMPLDFQKLFRVCIFCFSSFFKDDIHGCHIAEERKRVVLEVADLYMFVIADQDLDGG